MSRKASPKRNQVKKTKKRIIIFSSKESLELAKAVQGNLSLEKYTTTTWTDGFFKLSQSYMSNFVNIQYDYDYVVVICGADDVRRTRSNTKMTPRDNVLLELGLCIGSFGLGQVIIVKRKEVVLPSDLDGITYIPYEEYVDKDLPAVAGTIGSRIDSHIANANISKNGFSKLSWDEYFHSMKKLTQQLSASGALGGFEYDAIVGINRGGLMAADLIAREQLSNVPIVPLYADRRRSITRFDTEEGVINNLDIMTHLDNGHVHNILLVDSFTRDGVTIIEAKDYLTSLLPNKNIKSAVIYANERIKGNQKVVNNIDYIGDFKNLDGKKLSLE